MNQRTRKQLLALSDAFYRAHAEGFDASRGHHAWPGWQRLLAWLPDPQSTITALPAEAAPLSPEQSLPRPLAQPVTPPLSVLDIGCGNARLASFLHNVGFELQYTGVDANATLLAKARERLGLGPDSDGRCTLTEHNFLDSERPGSELPAGPFNLIALMGVLHHVPGREWRLDLLRAAAERLAPGGVLALATWQFGHHERFAKRIVAWRELGSVDGDRIDLNQLEDGDHLLRFGEDASAPPRYCHQVSDAEFESWPAALRLSSIARYHADGAEGALNRYWILANA